MFICRERELSSLEKLYSSDKFEFVVLYGRRRVGKTALINHFIDGKPAIYFMGVESNAKQNLENLSRSIFEYMSGVEADTSFQSFQAALETVFRLSSTAAIRNPSKSRVRTPRDHTPSSSSGSWFPGTQRYFPL